MGVDESGSIDESRLARLLTFEEALAGGGSGGDLLADGPGAGESLLALRECVRLLEDVLPARPEADGGDPIGAGASPERIGRFAILGELGRGGFGVVLRAFDPALKRQVALKVPRPEFLANPEAKRRFLREGWASSRLEHPNIVSVLEAGEAGPIGYIASALCEGPSLAAWLAVRSEPVPPKMAARLVAALAGAIAHAHGRDVLHRDLKPANILLQGGEVGPHAVPGSGALPFVPRVCDFGLAKLLDQEADETRTAAVLGSPPYMAPEQADGRPDRIGPATDIHGLGTILYELLTGRPPFRGESGLETLRMVARDDPPPPRTLRPGVPIDLETIALKCLEKRPEHRYPTAAALADDLTRFLDDRPISARPSGPLRRAAKWARRRPAAASLAAFLALASLGASSALVAGQWWQARQNARLREVNTRLEEVNDRLEDAVGRAERSERDSRRRYFGSIVRQTQAAFEGGHRRLALSLLDTARRLSPPAEDPGFAWSRLDRQLRAGELVLEGGGPPIRALDVSPDGRTLAAVEEGGTAVFWDLPTRRVRFRHHIGFNRVRCTAFSPDSRTFSIVHIRDPRGGPVTDPLCATLFDVDAPSASPRTMQNYCPIRVVFSRDGGATTSLHGAGPDRKFRLSDYDLAAGSLSREQGIARTGFVEDPPLLRLVADALDGKPVSPPPEMPSRVVGVAFTEDGQIAVVARGGPEIELFDRTAKPLAASIPVGPSAATVVIAEFRPREMVPLPGWEARVDRLRRLAPPGRREAPFWRTIPEPLPRRFSPSGDRLAVARPFSADLETVDLRTGAIDVYQSEIQTTALAIPPDSKSLIAGGIDGRIRIRAFAPPRETITFRAHEKETWGVAWSPDGKSLATSSDDGSVRLWDLDGDAPPRRRAELTGHRALATTVSWSPDGRSLASSGYNPRDVRLWDPATGDCLAVLSGHEGIVRMVSWSPDGRSLASCGDDGTTRLWDRGSTAPVRTMPAGGDPAGEKRLGGVSWSPDGRALASSGLDGRVILWDPAVGREIRSWTLGEQVHAVAFSPDGRMLAASDKQGAIRVWDPGSSTIDGALTLRGDTQWSQTLAFSPDGRSLASAGFDRIVRIWDPVTGQELLALAGHSAQVHRVAWSPDGRSLASCDHDGVVKLWRSGIR